MKRAHRVIAAVLAFSLSFTFGICEIPAENGLVNASSNSADVGKVLYSNGFANGRDDCLNVTNNDGSIAYNLADVVTSEYEGSRGIGLDSDAWPDSVIKYTFASPLDEGTLCISFDTARLDIVSPQPSYLIFNDSKYIFYMLDGSFMGPLNELAGWGDDSVTLPYAAHTLYHINLKFDFTSRTAYTYVNEILLSERTIPEGFAITSIDFQLSMVNEYFDNLVIAADPAVYKEVLYNNDYTNGRSSCLNSTTDSGSITYKLNDVVGAEYGGNRGIGLERDGWPDSVIKYTLAEPFDRGTLSIAYDTARLNIVSPQSSYLLLNDSRYVFYMLDGSFWGPNNELSGWGDSSVSLPFESNTLYHIELKYNLTNRMTYTYVNGILLSERTIAAGFSITSIDFRLSMINEYFDNLVISAEYPTPILITLNSAKSGNIFFEDETVELTANAVNTSDIAVNDMIYVSVTDSKGAAVYNEMKDIILQPGERLEYLIRPDVPLFGTYNLRLTSNRGALFNLKFSRCVRSDKVNPVINVCACSGARRSMDVGLVFDLISAAGFGGVRTDFVWKETAAGYEDMEEDSFFSSVFSESAEHGVELLALLPVSNTSYEPDADGGFNTSTEALTAYKNYCTYIANKFKGRISYFELGNEQNYMRKSDGSADVGSDYLKLLEAGYEGIKAANPVAKVLTAGMQMVYSDDANNQQPFIRSLLGAMKSKNTYSFDILGVHPYHIQHAPEIKDYWIENKSWLEQAQVAGDLLNEFGAEGKKMWATELGWSNASASEEDTAAWFVRLYALNEAYGYHEKIYVYDIINAGLDKTNMEHNFGMLNYVKNPDWCTSSAYTAKSAYLATAQWNKLMTGAECESVSAGTDGKYMVDYKLKGKGITVIWDVSDSGAAVKLERDAEETVVYDMYGNILQHVTDGSDITVNAKAEPIYVVSTESIAYCTVNGERVTDLNGLENGALLEFTAKTSGTEEKKFIVTRFRDNRMTGVTLKSFDVNGEAKTSDTFDGQSGYRLMIWNWDGSIQPVISAVHIGRINSEEE